MPVAFSIKTSYNRKYVVPVVAAKRHNSSCDRAHHFMLGADIFDVQYTYTELRCRL